MEVFFPDSCQRSFDEVIRYFCFGCTSREPRAVNRTQLFNATTGKPLNKTSKTILLCKTYAEDLWGGDITKPSTRFDNCGMTTYWLDPPYDSNVILPSLKFANISQFFAAVKPPLFEEYDISIVDENIYPDCYGN